VASAGNRGAPADAPRIFGSEFRPSLSLARLAVEPRLPVVVVLAVDDDATVFVMLNRIVAGWMTLVVLASKDDPMVRRCAAGKRCAGIDSHR
jgi:hypothetical protein